MRDGMTVLVKGFRCRHILGSASESLQGKNPREVVDGLAASAMGGRAGGVGDEV